MNESYKETLFNFLYGDINGYSVSHEAREKHNNSESVKDLLYGEVPFKTLEEILKKANPVENGVFFDLGSGTGRIVIAMNLLSNFSKTVGVELLEILHQKACEVKKEFENHVVPKIPNYDKNREINFLNASILDVDLSEADFVFMNHPFKDRDLFAKLEEKLISELKKGTKIVTIIRKLENPKIKFINSQKYNFSWGESTAYFHTI
jgi:hypothetical protein